MTTRSKSRQDSGIMHPEERQRVARHSGQSSRHNYENDYENDRDDYDEFGNSSRARNSKFINDDEDYDNRNSLRNDRRDYNDFEDVREGYGYYGDRRQQNRDLYYDERPADYNRNSEQNGYSRRGFGSMSRHNPENERRTDSYSNEDRGLYFNRGRSSYSNGSRGSYTNGERDLYSNSYRDSYSNGDRGSYSDGDRRRSYDDERRTGRGYAEQQYGNADGGSRYDYGMNEEYINDGSNSRRLQSSDKRSHTSTSRTSSSGKNPAGRTVKKTSATKK